MQKNLQQSPFAAIQPGFAGLRPESKTRPAEKTYNLLSVCDALKSAIP